MPESKSITLPIQATSKQIIDQLTQKIESQDNIKAKAANPRLQITTRSELVAGQKNLKFQYPMTKTFAVKAALLHGSL